MAQQVLTTAPNWATPLLERLEWKTDILKSKNGLEQRIKLRENPRHTIEYDFLVTRQELRELQVQLLRWQGTLWVVPLWMHVQQTTQDLPVYQSRIYLPKTSSYEYQVGSYICLWGSRTVRDILKVAAVGSNYVDTQSPTTKAWPAGTPVMPGRDGRLRESITLKAITAETATGVIQAVLENTASFSYAVNTLVDGLTYFSYEPNRANAVDTTWQRNVGYIDYQTGPIAAYDLEGRSSIVRTFDYLHIGRAAVSRVRSLLNHCDGMQKAFLLPSFQCDMEVVGGPYSAGQNLLYIRDINYTEDDFSRLNYAYIRIELTSGQPMVRRVIAAAPSSISESGVDTGALEGLALHDSQGIILQDSTGILLFSLDTDLNSVTNTGATNTDMLTLATPFGVAFTIDQVRRVSRVALNRLDSDAVEFSWMTPNVVNTAMTVREILT
jgi:hypothetical protein